MTTDQRPSIWSRLLGNGEQPLPREVADYILRLTFPEADRQRVDELADRCQLGTLTGAERKEYEEYVQAGLLLSLWQAQARRAIRVGKGPC